MKIRTATFLVVIIAALAFLPNVSAQCCGSPLDEFEHFGIETTELTVGQIWSGDRFVNGSLIIDSELRLIDCDLVISGEGIMIKENGSLIATGSSISAYYSDVGFYMESHGILSLVDSSIDGCLDMNNQYFSIYLMDGEVVLENAEFTRSGLIQSHLDDVEINNSSLPGIISFGGNVSIYSSTIDSIGASTVGGGDLMIEDSFITSNLSFSNSIAAVSCEEGVLTIDDVFINGSYGGGVYSKNSTSDLNGLDIDLPGGLYGVRFEYSSATTIDMAYIKGPQYGMEFIDCSGQSFISDSVIDAVRVGIETTGPGSLNIFNTMVIDSSYGLISSGHVNMANTSFWNNQIGMLLEDQYTFEQMDCSIQNYSRYGVEIESWDPQVNIPMNMTGGMDSKADLAFWGRIDILVKGPNGESVEGATLDLSSNMGMSNQISAGPIGLIWGHRNNDTPINNVVYSLIGSWGNAEDTIVFEVIEGGEVELILPLTDIHVYGLEFNGDEAVVSLGANGTEAEDVIITVYLDGSYRFSQRVSLSEGENVTVDLPLGDIENGDHILKAVISSKDEYNGMNGILQNNNELDMNIEVEDEGNDGLQVLPIILLVVAVFFIIMVLLLRRKD